MMNKKLLFIFLFSGLVGLVQAQTPAVTDQGGTQETAQEAVQTDASAESAVAAPGTEVAAEDAKPENPDIAKDLAQATDTASEVGETLSAVRETVDETPAPRPKKDLVVFNPKSKRDPTLSPDDFLLLQYREQQRLAAIEAERQRKLAEERRKREEEERLRQLELARIKDPTREVRGLIKIEGIIGKEVFIGDKVYTIGNKVFGARITQVTSDSVVFSYKGHTFVKKMQ